MRKFTVLLFSLLLFTLPASAQNIYTISAIRAYLYYDDTGEIDKRDLIKVQPGELHNTVIGEGMALRPSNTTLLLVEVSGPSFAIKDVGTLNLKAVTDMWEKGKTVKKVIFDQSIDLNNYFQEKSRKVVVPFWLYQTGSSPIILTATLKGGKDAKGQVSTLVKTIPFGGGE